MGRVEDYKEPNFSSFYKKFSVHTLENVQLQKLIRLRASELKLQFAAHVHRFFDALPILIFDCFSTEIRALLRAFAQQGAKAIELNFLGIYRTKECLATLRGCHKLKFLLCIHFVEW